MATKGWGGSTGSSRDRQGLRIGYAGVRRDDQRGSATAGRRGSGASRQHDSEMPAESAQVEADGGRRIVDLRDLELQGLTVAENEDFDAAVTAQLASHLRSGAPRQRLSTYAKVVGESNPDALQLSDSEGETRRSRKQGKRNEETTLESKFLVVFLQALFVVLMIALVVRAYIVYTYGSAADVRQDAQGVGLVTSMVNSTTALL